ncbi:MAG: AsmA-like C-terminal domain-containing protein [Pseudomonadota bacterium]
MQPTTTTEHEETRSATGAPLALRAVRLFFVSVLVCAAIGLSGVLAIAGLVLTGNLPMAAVTPVIEHIASERLGGRVEIRGLAVAMHDERLHAEADTIFIEGPYTAKLSGAQVDFSVRDLLSRSAVIDRLDVARIRATVPIVRRSGETSGGALSFEQLLGWLSRGAGDVALRDIDVVYGNGDEITLNDASVRANPVSDGYAINASLPFEVSGTLTTAALDVVARRGGVTDFQLTSDGAPIQPLLSLAGIDAVQLDTKFKGQVLLSVDADGTPVGGAFDVRLRPGAGQVGDVPFVFGENVLTANFDGLSPRFVVKNLKYDIADNRGSLTGAVRVQKILTPAEVLMDFDLIGERILVNLGEVLDGPVMIERVVADGTFDAAARRVAFAHLSSSYFGSAVNGSLALTFPEGFRGSPRIESDATLPGPLTPQQVLAGWPRPLAREAREWVVENLAEGIVTDLRYTSDIAMNAIQPEQGIDDASMRFTFNAEDATVRYLEELPLLEDLKAKALVTGNSFSVIAERGTIAGVAVAGGELRMPQFYPKGADARFSAKLVGRIPTVLRVLQTSGLVEFDDNGYQPDAFSGRGSFDLNVTWPLIAEPLEEDIKISGSGSFVRGGIDNVLPGIDATEAEGKVILTPKRLTVRGEGRAASAPATFEWRQALTEAKTADLTVTAQLNAAAADMVGLPLREFFDGEVKTEIYAQDLSPGAPMEIIGNLINAEVDIPALGLTKSVGLEGFFETTAIIPEITGADEQPGLIELPSLKLTAPNFNIEGSGIFTADGGVIRLELPRFYIEDRADLSLRLVTDEGQLDVGLFGAHADATPVLEELFSQSEIGGNLPGRSTIDIALDRVSLQAGVDLNDLRAEGRHNGKDFDELMVRAGFREGEQLSITFDRPLGEQVGYVEVETTDFGSLAAGVFGIESITGAPGSLKGTALATGGFTGRFETRQLIIKEAPILARLLSVTSLDGLADLLNGEGIRFDKLEGDVWFKDGRIGLSDAKLVGSSIGISANGVVDLNAGQIDVRGAIAPAYAVNSVLGILPGIGRLFVSREGEGIVAFAYSLSGPIDQPTVTVNTLTALTPGILRRIFEPLEEGAEGTQALLDKAIAEAGQTAAPPTPDELDQAP